MSYYITQVDNPGYYEIPGGVHFGKTIIVRGVLLPGAEKFEVDFLQAQDVYGPNGFHFNPRPAEGAIVRNSYIDGYWMEEERDGADFPFIEGADFELRFVCGEGKYTVFINGSQFCDYATQLPYSDVHYIYLAGDAEFYEVSSHDHMTVPYFGAAPRQSMQVGQAVRVRGAVAPGGANFSVNFHTGITEEGDRHFHFNPRIEESVVVRNSMMYGEWGDEERSHPGIFDAYPFAPGEFFDLVIYINPDCYRCLVNDKWFCDFAHRGDISEVHGVHIEGDVSLAEVVYFDGLAESITVPIAGCMSQGDCVVLRGYAPEGSNGFQMNIQTEAFDGSDIGFHFNPRFGGDKYVANSLVGGDWGDEETHGLSGFFKYGEPFEVRIVAFEDAFEVFVNKYYFTKFNFRLPLESLKYASVTGDCNFSLMKCNKGQLLARIGHYVDQIPGNLSVDRWIGVNGIPDRNAEKFQVELLLSSFLEGEVAYHFNPRFHDGRVVRNTNIGGWGDEETHGGFPFKEQEIFEIFFHITEGEIETYVNGRFFEKFPHRAPVEVVSHVGVQGNAIFWPIVIYD